MQKRHWKGFAKIMDATQMVEGLLQTAHKRVTIEVQTADMHRLGFRKNHAYTMQKSGSE